MSFFVRSILPRTLILGLAMAGFSGAQDLPLDGKIFLTGTSTVPGALVLGKDTSTGGYTGLILGLTQVSGGAATIQGIKSSGSTFGDVVINPGGGSVGIGRAPAFKLHAFGEDANGWVSVVETTASRGLLFGAPGNVASIGTIAGKELVLAPTIGNVGAAAVGIGGVPTARFQIRDASYGDSLGFFQPQQNRFAIQTLLDDRSLIGYGTYGGDVENGLSLQPYVGNVGIGTINPQSKLAVNGAITAKEVVITLLGWSDNVLAPSYRLPALNEVSAHIAEHGCLPGVPNEAEVVRAGVAVGEMQKIQMAKIEELTLYAIAADGKLKRTDEKLANLEAENIKLTTRLAAIERLLSSSIQPANK